LDSGRVGGPNAKLDAASCGRYESTLAEGSDSIAGGRCNFAGGVCSCTTSSVAMTLPPLTMYEVQGDQLILDGTSNPFCVTGDQLLVRTSASAMEEGTLTFQRK
jgi:hypothetical protein